MVVVVGFGVIADDYNFAGEGEGAQEWVLAGCEVEVVVEGLGAKVCWEGGNELVCGLGMRH